MFVNQHFGLGPFGSNSSSRALGPIPRSATVTADVLERHAKRRILEELGKAMKPEERKNMPHLIEIPSITVSRSGPDEIVGRDDDAVVLVVTHFFQGDGTSRVSHIDEQAEEGPILILEKDVLKQTKPRDIQWCLCYMEDGPEDEKIPGAIVSPGHVQCHFVGNDFFLGDNDGGTITIDEGFLVLKVSGENDIIVLDRLLGEPAKQSAEHLTLGSELDECKQRIMGSISRVTRRRPPRALSSGR